MTLKVGDPIFDEKGNPGTILKLDKDRGSYVIDNDREATKEESRYGYHVGLVQRERFLEIMDDISDIDDIPDKISELTKKIKEIEKEPDPRSFRLSRYLKSELTHIMNSESYQPETYEIEAGKLRST